MLKVTRRVFLISYSPLKRRKNNIGLNKKSNNTMLVMLCTGANFVKKKSCLVAGIVFDAADLHLLTFLILEPYPSKNIELDLSHVISH